MLELVRNNKTCLSLATIALLCGVSYQSSQASNTFPSSNELTEDIRPGELVATGGYVNGKRDGKWTIVTVDGKRETGEYQLGERHGLWNIRFSDEAGEHIETGKYEKDARQGKWLLEKASGITVSMNYKNGLLHGPWKVTSPEGELEKGTYKAGKRTGQWSIIFANTELGANTGAIGHFHDDKRHGRWVFHSSDTGRTKYGDYKDGTRHGYWWTYPIDAGAARLVPKSYSLSFAGSGKSVYVFQVRQNANMHSLDDLKNARICMPAGSDSWVSVTRYLDKREIRYKATDVDTMKLLAEGNQYLRTGICDAVVNLVNDPSFFLVGSTDFVMLSEAIPSAALQLVRTEEAIQSEIVMARRLYANGEALGKWELVTNEYGPQGEGDLVDNSGKLQGKWRFEWPDGRVDTGDLIDNAREGVWTVVWADGVWERGVYMGGRRHGTWTVRWPSGTKEIGSYTSDERTGYWWIAHKDGHIEKGIMSNGRRNGHWIIQWPDGVVSSGYYVNGVRQGNWALQWPNGVVEYGRFIDGMRQGLWKMKYRELRSSGVYTDGVSDMKWIVNFLEERQKNAGFTTAHGQVVGSQHGFIAMLEGKLRHINNGSYELDSNNRVTGSLTGIWAFFSNGIYAKGAYSWGKRVGQWIYRGWSGIFDTGKHVSGNWIHNKRDGLWERRHPSGMVVITNRENNVAHGKTTIYFPDGSVSHGFYANGTDTGIWETRLPNGRVNVQDRTDWNLHYERVLIISRDKGAEVKREKDVDLTRDPPFSARSNPLLWDTKPSFDVKIGDLP